MKNTAVTDNDWVCERGSRPTDLFTLGVVGLIFGAAVLSALADYKGRKLSFYVCIVVVCAFCLASIWASHSYPLYVAIKVRELWSWYSGHLLIYVMRL